MSLVRGGQIPLTRDAWIGAPFQGHLTGFPSVDVQSVGAGGGSIAHVDSGGLLKVGPQSAGAVPGPVCYGRGGSEPTLSDACVALGYVDPEYFLGGAMPLDKDAASAAIKEKIADPLGMSTEEAAAAIVTLATENMVQAIADITVNQGIDPQQAVLIGGGGAAGLNSIFIARRLSIPRLVIPEVGAALSAAGALMSELAADYRAVDYMTTADFDRGRANDIISGLRQQAEAFLAGIGDGGFDPKLQFSVEARYEQQVWEIEVALPVADFGSGADIHRLNESMHKTHERIFAFRDEQSAVEIIGWSVRASARVHERIIRAHAGTCAANAAGNNQAGLVSGNRQQPRRPSCRLPIWKSIKSTTAPAMVESPFSTVVIDPGSIFWRLQDGSLVIDTQIEGAAA